MNISSLYPQAFQYTLVKGDELVISKAKWIETRGFYPFEALYETNNQWLVQPLYSDYNQFLGYQIRDLTEEEAETKYKSSATIYHNLVKTDKRDLEGIKIICEGTIDCALLRMYGFNAFTCLGLKQSRLFNLRKELIDNETTAFFCFDNDNSGYEAMNIFKRLGLFLRVPFQYKDINEYLLKNKKDFLLWITNIKQLLSVPPLIKEI